MEAFLNAYHDRGESSTGKLLADVGIISRGRSGDPASLQDFLNALPHGDKKLSSQELAALIVDALVDCGAISPERCEEAIATATAEIDARKAVRDY